MLKVSVVIPVYNVELYLKRCLESLLNQTLEDIEIIIINDGSKDTSELIINQYLKKFKHIKYISQKNQGLSEARNVGIKCSTTPYITFIDSDDSVHRNMLKELYEEIIYTNADIVSSPHQLIVNNEIKSFMNDQICADKQEFFEELLACRVSSMSCARMYKKALFIENNCFFPKNLFFEDVGTLYKLAYFAKKISYIDKPLYYYYSMREGSISVSINEKKFDDLLAILKQTKEFLIDKNIYDEYQDLYLERAARQIINKFKLIQEPDVQKRILKKIKKIDIFTQYSLRRLSLSNLHVYMQINIFIIEHLNEYATLEKNQAYNDLLLNTSKKYSMLYQKKNQITLKHFHEKFTQENCFVITKPLELNINEKYLQKQKIFGIHQALFSNINLDLYLALGDSFIINNKARIERYQGAKKILPDSYQQLFGESQSNYYIRYEEQELDANQEFDFSYAPFENLNGSFGSVIAALQILYFLDFQKVYLVDISFQSKEAQAIYLKIEKIYQDSNKELVFLCQDDLRDFGIDTYCGNRDFM